MAARKATKPAGKRLTPVRLARKRVAIGPPRPQYLDSRDADKLMIMMLALAAEVSAMRDRLDTHEALAEKHVAPIADSVEAYELPATRRAQRETRRVAMLHRVLRVLTEEVDAIREAAQGQATHV